MKKKYDKPEVIKVDLDSEISILMGTTWFLLYWFKWKASLNINSAVFRGVPLNLIDFDGIYVFVAILIN